MEVLEAQNWNELNDFLWRASFHKKSGKWRSYTAFRGLSKDHCNLKTSLQRLGGDLNLKERRFIDTFRNHMRLQLRSGLSDWDVMLLGQHHGLPTRFLDWTLSPLAALFFATEKFEHHDKDGVVWCVRRNKTKRFLPLNLRKLLKSRSTNMFSLEMLATEFPLISDLDKLKNTCVLFFEPPSVSSRIESQYACFTVMPRVQSELQDWLMDHEDLCWKVMIPAKLKKEIRERLMVMNISERTIYPGLDGTSRWLGSWYR